MDEQAESEMGALGNNAVSSSSGSSSCAVPGVLHDALEIQKSHCDSFADNQQTSELDRIVHCASSNKVSGVLTEASESQEVQQTSPSFKDGPNSFDECGQSHSHPLTGSSPSSSSSKPRARGMVIELCAGSAMLSRCFHEQGFIVMPIDRKQNRCHPLAKICNLSLTEQSSWDYLFWLLDNEIIVFCHAAPPCGTCSRARELPGGPPPLRNEAFPWGFEDLSSDQRARVDAANKIYVGLARFIEALISRNILYSDENPRSSLLWELPIWEKILRSSFYVTFDACMYGGQKKSPNLC